MFTTEITRTLITYLSIRLHKVNSNAKSLIADKQETIYTEMRQPPFHTRQAKKLVVSERLRHNPAGYTF